MTESNALTINQVAQICHEANRALQIVQADPTIPISPLWEDLDEETKKSAESGVLGVVQRNTPEQSHENWCAFKIAHGWKLGPVKNEETKEHPLLVPYAELPESQKLKDALFVSIVTTVKETVGVSSA